jgi:formate-dependent nitrite reductase membrane component NrfD
MLAKPASSELSRGLWVILLFTVVGFFQVAPAVVPALPWTGNTLAFKVIMGIICILMITHGFLTMNVVRAIPVWNSSMMTPLSLISGIWVGSQIVILLLRLTGHEIGAAEIWARWSLFCFIALLGAFLLGAAHSSATVKLSIKGLVAGEWSGPFYIGVVVIGILIPVIVTLIIWGKNIDSVGAGILLLRCVCVVIGDLTMRYGIMRSALYSPLI